MFVDRGQTPQISVFFSFMALLLWTSLAAAQQRVPLTLAAAEDLALQDEPGQAALLAHAEAFEERAVAAGQLPDPTMRVALANYPTDGGGFSSEPMTQAQLLYRQQFPRRKVRDLSTDRLQHLAEGQSDSAAARSREVLAATRRAWLEAFYWQRALQLVSESRPFFADLLTITRSMYAVGRKSQHDVLQAELELSRLDERIIEAERALAESQAMLSEWLGADAWRPIALKPPAWETVPGYNELLQGLAAHPALGAADADIAANETAVELAEERKKPGWALDLGYGYRDGYTSSGEPRSNLVSVGVTVELPFFSKNRQDRYLAGALADRRAATATRARLYAYMQSQLRAEYVRWSDLTRRLELYDTRILAQSEAQAQSALLAYQSDTGNFSDVMRGYIDNLNTRLDHVRLQVARDQSYAMLANLGGLSDEQ